MPIAEFYAEKMPESKNRACEYLEIEGIRQNHYLLFGYDLCVNFDFSTHGYEKSTTIRQHLLLQLNCALLKQ